MKSLALWTLLIAAVLPLTACHWHHRRHHFAEGYSEKHYAQNDLNHSAVGESSPGA